MHIKENNRDIPDTDRAREQPYFSFSLIRCVSSDEILLSNRGFGNVGNVLRFAKQILSSGRWRRRERENARKKSGDAVLA